MRHPAPIALVGGRRPSNTAITAPSNSVRPLKRTTIPFKFETPPNAPQTKRAREQWYCLLDKTTWEKHKKALAVLANDVHGAWREIRRRGAEA